MNSIAPSHGGNFILFFSLCTSYNLFWELDEQNSYDLRYGLNLLSLVFGQIYIYEICIQKFKKKYEYFLIEFPTWHMIDIVICSTIACLCASLRPFTLKSVDGSTLAVPRIVNKRNDLLPSHPSASVMTTFKNEVYPASPSTRVIGFLHPEPLSKYFLHSTA